jgi:hypothetical protein
MLLAAPLESARQVARKDGRLIQEKPCHTMACCLNFIIAEIDG